MADDTGSCSSATGASAAASGTGGGFVALRSGLIIRHYIIEEVIGAGGFGITYRARHQRLSSKVFALKEFFPRQFAARQGTHVVSTPDGDGLFRWGLDRFLKEAEALAKCQHPGIVDVVDYFEENGTAYAVLGYVEGQQLGQWLDSLARAPTQAELDRILMPLLDALEVVHEARLLHRDIAPDNILIRRDGAPCLIDFGACREDIRDRSRKLSAIVKHGYSPPEQYHGIAELQGPWTDIYAVAATVYRAISGQAPMDSSRRGALGDALRPVSEMTASEYRTGFLAAIDAALHLKPEERPQSIAEWRTRLLSKEPAITFAAPQPDRSPAIELLPSPRDDVQFSALANAPPPPRALARRGPLLAVAALALVAVGAAAWWRGTERLPNTPAVPATPVAAPSSQSADGGPPTSDSIASASPTPATPATPVPSPSLSPPSPTPETLAEAAWRPLADSNDIAAIEHFVAEHGSTQAASAAHTRLAALRDEERRKADRKTEAERAKTKADAAESRQQTLDNNWQACRAAPEATRPVACGPVIQSDDTPGRRAAAWHLLGTAARNAGNYDKAIADYTQSLALVPADAQVLNDRGIAHFLKGGAAARTAALEDYNLALLADPGHAEALNNRAWSLLQAGQAIEALADANRSIEATPTNGYAYDTRGQILEALGRKEDAVRDYERALNIDPSQETSRAGLARLKASAR